MLSDSIFSSWGLSPEVLKSISTMGFKDPTPIQTACVPHLLEKGGDLVALAKTGTGKTAAFGIPLAEKLTATPELQALILCPTRELASQVAQNLAQISQAKGLRVVTVLGGESYRKQIQALQMNPQILVSTPGRLVDLMDQGKVKLNHVRYFILDEADEMLSFGFQEALESVWKALRAGNTEGDGEAPKRKVDTWLFSATMSSSIRQLAGRYLDKPHQVVMNTTIEPSRVQAFAAVVYEEDKEDALTLLLKSEPEFYGIVFAQTKKQVSEMETKFRSMGFKVDSLHGDKVQVDRTRVIQRMKRKEIQILIATDVAARGLDIDGLTHVVNFEMPWDVETYTHRIGRTARAGKTGIVWTLVPPKQVGSLRKFERALQFEFKSLAIPSVDEVKKQQISRWLKNLSEIAVAGPEKKLYQEIFLDFQVQEDLELMPDVSEWLMKAMALMKVGVESHQINQPRSFELKKAIARTSTGSSPSFSRGGGGGRSYGPRRDRGDWGGGGARRADRSDRAEGGRYDRPRSESSGPRRDRGDRPERSERFERSADERRAPARSYSREGAVAPKRSTERSFEGSYGGRPDRGMGRSSERSSDLGPRSGGVRRGGPKSSAPTARHTSR